MVSAVITSRVAALQGKLDEFAAMADVAQKAVRIGELEGRMSTPGFWDDQAVAQQVIGELKILKNIVDPHREMEDALAACSELGGLTESDAEIEEILTEVQALEERFTALELSLALSGEYDASNVYLSIQPGAGGTDARDWAEMLLRMYSAYAQKAGYSVEIIEIEEGKDAGLQSCTLMIKGDMAYGYLKSEMGTHRLVRISPFNSGGTRETSFAAVEVTPELPDAAMVGVADLDDKEFRIDTFRASGAGGQHINKTDSAVRITHLPSGIVTSCQSERSQVQNRDRAWKMMAAKLQQVNDAERLEELQALQGERGTIGWGHQIRSYVLHPYQMVKDLRTSHEVSNVDAVLGGDLQGFIDSYLRWRLSQTQSS
ncbi:MAG: peptide chain release factor 2 [Planctomycetota bacterium]|nr:MAG: peptide chain release factor 2 [Planctomycetota bacterium]